jgi:serine/threonine protein kinase
VSTEIAVTQRVIAERYEVVRVLGEGASARTLLCRDLEAERDVALKELHVAHMDDWKRLELFEREAKVLAGLRHHAIPEIFDSIELEEDGRVVLILVQELIDGLSLDRRMEEGPTLGQTELIQLTLGVLDVLEYLHGRSPPVYHRDIKPSNIIVRPTGAPVLVDFGSVTHGWRPAGAAGSTVTGTFGYMPPEQLLGQVGPTSDLYALGATLLHLLTGRSPTDFSFDSGRIEVPEELPAPAAMRQLVCALLEPAPNKRPATVKDARAILLGQGGGKSTALLRVDDRPPAVIGGDESVAVIGGDGSAAVIGGDAPKQVEVGPPPREREGEVYGLLVDPLNLISGAHSSAGRVGRTVGVSLLYILSIGIYPTVYYLDRAKRRRRYDEVFRLGVRTTGRVVEVIGNRSTDIYLTIRYAFMADTVKCRGYITYPTGMTKLLGAGDRVSVLYIEDDPAESCIVFRV